MRIGESVFAQEVATKQILDLLAPKVATAIVIAGAEGSGKKQLARDTAQYILCHNKQETGPCAICPACKYFEAGTHPDYKYLEAEQGSKVIKIEELKAVIPEDVYRRPEIAEAKVYVIDGTALSEQAQNKILKTVEELPPYLYILITVNSLESLLPTLRSRMAELRLRPLSVEQMKALLVKQAVELDVATALVYLTEGSATKAIQLASNEWLIPFRKFVWEFLSSLPNRAEYRILGEDFSEFEKQKDEYKLCLEILRSFLRDIRSLAISEHNKCLINEDFKRALLSTRLNISEEGFIRISQAIDERTKGLQVNENFEMSICSLLLALKEEINYV